MSYAYTKSESFIFVYIQETLIKKLNVKTQFLNTKSPFEFVFLRCEFTKVIFNAKSWCEMLVVELSGIQNVLNICFELD